MFPGRRSGLHICRPHALSRASRWATSLAWEQLPRNSKPLHAQRATPFVTVTVLNAPGWLLLGTWKTRSSSPSTLARWRSGGQRSARACRLQIPTKHATAGVQLECAHPLFTTPTGVGTGYRHARRSKGVFHGVDNALVAREDNHLLVRLNTLSHRLN